MSNVHGTTSENFMSVFPKVLANNEKLFALAKAVAVEIEKNIAFSRRITIYSRIDELPEELLDILAKDFKIDWWDPNYSLEEKRLTFKNSPAVHRSLGTVEAVEKAISAIYPGAEVLEWFDYGGAPFHFKLIIGEVAEISKHLRVLERLAIYKNVRSVLDDVNYFENCGTNITVACGLTDFEKIDGAEITLF